MKKKYIMGILLFLVLIALGFGLFITSKSHTNKANSPKKTNIIKNDNNQNKNENPKYTIPNEYVGNWYQKDQKTKITKTSVQMATDSNHTITKNSNPMPLDVHKQNGFQYFWQGALMKMDGNYQWKKDGDGMPFWIAKMTVDGKKQNVLASMQHDFISIWTEEPTSKDYSFDLPANVKIPTKPIIDLDGYAKSGTSKEDIDKQSDSDNGLTQAEAQKLVPGAISKYLKSQYSVTPINKDKYNDVDGWSFKINGEPNIDVHVTADDEDPNRIEFSFYNLANGHQEAQHIEALITYHKDSGKYMDVVEETKADTNNQSTNDSDSSDDSSDTNKNNSDEDDD